MTPHQQCEKFDFFYSQNILHEKSTETSICDNNIRVV